MPQRKKTDRMYISMSEYARDGHGGMLEGQVKAIFKALPFDCCALSLVPFKDPVCTLSGVIYDIMNIIPWLKKYGKDPASGKKFKSRDLIKLNFAKSLYMCPVLFKEFNENSHIVAIRTTGNVFSRQVIDELNIKANRMEDLISGVPFTKSDIITIQDPDNLNARNLNCFWYVREGVKSVEEDFDPAKHINMPSSAEGIMKAVAEKEKERRRGEEEKARKKQEEQDAADAALAAQGPEGKERLEQLKKHREFREKERKKIAANLPQHLNPESARFTSSSFDLKMIPERNQLLTVKKTKKKGYVSLKTNHGILNIQVHCDLVPKASENFLLLCESGYYDGTIFHRLVKNFVIQGGDPTGKGTGGKSFWKKPFQDEILLKSLKHQGIGVVSMANNGPDSNGSQFFITFKSAPHLDGKHSIFGQVVGGLDVLRALEKFPVDEYDRPLEEVKLNSAIVYVNPFNQLEEEEEEEKMKEEEEKEKREAIFDEEQKGEWYTNPIPELPKTIKTGVGKYIGLPPPKVSTKKSNTTKKSEEKRPSIDFSHEDVPVHKRRKASGFGNFSAW